jgi:hypothetical protein
LSGSQRFDIELDSAIALLATNPSLGTLVSHVFDVENAAEAFACAADSTRSSKVVLHLSADPDAEA